jgi:hypothetical protein
VDNGRRIVRAQSFTGSDAALDYIRRIYCRDRTEGQDMTVYIGVEKATMVAQLQSWFLDRGLTIIALGGYASQSYVDRVADDAEDRDRPAVLLYAGDFDPSGEDIDRDFVARTGCFDEVVRVALTPEQVDAYNLPPAPGKDKDRRAAAFTARHGRLVQVELEALDPNDLRVLYEQALEPFWDTSTFRRSLEQEKADLAELRRES